MDTPVVHADRELEKQIQRVPWRYHSLIRARSTCFLCPTRQHPGQEPLLLAPENLYEQGTQQRCQ